MRPRRACLKLQTRPLEQFIATAGWTAPGADLISERWRQARRLSYAVENQEADIFDSLVAAMLALVDNARGRSITRAVEYRRRRSDDDQEQLAPGMVSRAESQGIQISVLHDEAQPDRLAGKG